jgi:hypothetical protein
MGRTSLVSAALLFLKGRKTSASSSLKLGVAELVRVRVFLKSHDFSYPKT